MHRDDENHRIENDSCSNTLSVNEKGKMVSAKVRENVVVIMM